MSRDRIVMRSKNRAFRFELLASLLAVTAWSSPVFAVTELVTCGMQVAGAVVLPADLDCSAEPLPSVFFTANGSLALNGHTLIGEVRAAAGVLNVVGPGTITGPGDGVVNLGDTNSAKVNVVAADIVNNEGWGVIASGSNYNAPAAATITDSSVSGNVGGVSVSSGQRVPYFIPRSPLKFIRSRADGNAACGLMSPHITVKDSSVSGNGDCGLRLGDHTRKSIKVQRSHLDANVGAGIYSYRNWTWGRLSISDSTMIGNGTGIYYLADDSYDNRLTLKRTTIQDNDYGLLTTLNDVRATSCEISGNHIAGISYVAISDRPVALRDTSVSGNGTSADCGTTEVCADLDTDVAPALGGGATCETSHVYGSGLPGSSWGTCSLD